MILTTCAACAAPLAHDAPGCGVCATRYMAREIKSSMHYARSLLPVFRVAAEWFSYRNCILTRRKYFVNNAVDDGRDADMDDVLAS